MAGKPKAGFYVALAVVVAGLVTYAFKDSIFPKGDDPVAKNSDVGPIKLPPSPVEDATDAVALMATEYKIKSDLSPLPPPEGTGNYPALSKNGNTVRFALNVWAGWAPIIYANDGFEAKKIWKTPEGKEFKVELVLIDNPVAMRNAYAAGQVHIGWATLDMLPLLMEGFVDKNGKPKDPKVMPRVFQQIDWSNGGDGIVVREEIKQISDLRGKTIVLAGNSPSHYFALNMLIDGGVQPSEVDWKYTDDAFGAALAFNTEKSISAGVSWAPDIYNLEKVKGNRMLVTTEVANRLIADVWFARADFSRDHIDIIEGLVRGIFDGMDDMKDQKNQQKCSELMAAGYNMPAGEAMGMMADARSTNWAENRQFLLVKNNPANFEQVWNRAYYLYKRIGQITHRRVPFDQVMDPSIIAKLAKEDKYATQTIKRPVFVSKKPHEITHNGNQILTNTIIIHFFPNNADPNYEIEDGKLYDPNVHFIVKEIGRMVAQYGLAQIIIEGHTDSSMKGSVDAKLVEDLSLRRAQGVREALLKEFPDFDPKQFTPNGVGWARPANKDKPNDHAANRRVEVKIYPAEIQADVKPAGETGSQ